MQNSIELTLHMQCSYICLDFFILILARNHEEKWESTQKSPERKSQIYCIVPRFGGVQWSNYIFC